MDGRIFRENNFDDNYSIQKNVLEIKKYLEKLQSDLSKLRINEPGRRYTWREWEKKLDIVRETEHCVDLMIEIFHEENNGRPLQFGEWHGIHRYTFLIGKQICEMISRLVVHVIVNFHSSNIELHATLGKIPYKFNKVMDSYRRTSDKLLSKTTYGYMDETIHRRNINSFLKSCRDFNISVCQETNMALEVMKNSEFRLEEGFKQLLASVVNQFHYIEKGCWLTRHLLERPGPRSNGDLETTSIPLELEFKDMLNQIKCLLINGRYALRSLSYQEYYAVEVNVVCDDIKKLTNVLQSDTRDLNDLLKVTEAMSSKICKFIDLGDKCLPEGHQQIEDVTVMYSSDFDWTFEGDEVQGSESEENGNDFEEFIEDDKDDGSITRIPEEEIKDILASSGLAKTEMINVFKMEGFNSPVKISVNNRSEFIIPEVGGKVFYKGKWISAGDAKTEGTQVSMTIGPGAYFVVHYKFPETEKEVSKDEMERGLTIQIPRGECSVILSPSEVVNERANIKVKIHKKDENRIADYKQEHDYENLSVSDGVQLQTSEETNNEYVEFQNGFQPPQNRTYYCFRTSGFGVNDWECSRVEPELQNQNRFKLCGDNKVSYIVAADNVKSNKKKSDKILDLFLTLLGFKAPCKLLTLYNVPEEEDATINLCVVCIESKGSDLRNEASRYFMNNWIRIKECDESSDFLITQGDVIRLGFSGNIRPKEGNPPVITFIKRRSCFSRVELHCLDENKPRGCVQMNLNENTLDSKQLDWQYLLRKWERYQQGDVQDGVHRGSSTCNLL